MDNYKSNSILHAFDPNFLFHYAYHDEVRFVWGRYLDIATKKGKDPRSLYFGTSKNSNLLTGIFLGDNELTSKIKDVLLESKDNVVTLTVKYIDDEGKLSTIKTKLTANVLTEQIIEEIQKINQTIDIINSSISDVYNTLNIIDSSISIMTNRLDIIDSSIIDLNELLDNGKYNYSIHKTISPFSEGLKLYFTLYKGKNEQVDSSIIELNDYTLKKLEYNDSTNTITATSWPDAIGDDIYKYEKQIDADGNEQTIKVDKLDDDYIKKIDLNLDIIEKHFLNTVNTDSSVNDRLIFVENQLKWGNLIEN